MAEPIDLEKKKGAEQRLAVLALASTSPEPAGTCLTAEDLACLVEGRLEPERVEACLAHLAGCERCYAAWRLLDQEWQQSLSPNRKEKSLLKLVTRPRFLAATGSILAVAASIAVFLNITMETDREALLRFPAKPAQQQGLGVPPGESAAQPRENQLPALELPAAPTPQPLARQSEKKAPPEIDRPAPKQKAAAPSDASPAKTSRQAPLPRQVLPPTAQAPPPPIATRPPVDQQPELKKERSDKEIMDADPALTGRAMRAAEAPSANSAGTGSPPPTLAGWQRMIREGCQGQPSPNFFADISTQGRQLLAREDTDRLPHQDRQLINRILAVLTDPHLQTARQQCRALLEVLEPDAGTGPH